MDKSSVQTEELDASNIRSCYGSIQDVSLVKEDINAAEAAKPVVAIKNQLEDEKEKQIKIVERDFNGWRLVKLLRNIKYIPTSPSIFYYYYYLNYSTTKSYTYVSRFILFSQLELNRIFVKIILKCQFNWRFVKINHNNNYNRDWNNNGICLSVVFGLV